MQWYFNGERQMKRKELEKEIFRVNESIERLEKATKEITRYLELPHPYADNTTLSERTKRFDNQKFEYESLQDKKLKEEIRKLTIENDKKMDILIGKKAAINHLKRVDDGTFTIDEAIAKIKNYKN